MCVKPTAKNYNRVLMLSDSYYLSLLTHHVLDVWKRSQLFYSVAHHYVNSIIVCCVSHKTDKCHKAMSASIHSMQVQGVCLLAKANIIFLYFIEYERAKNKAIKHAYKYIAECNKCRQRSRMTPLTNRHIVL